MNMARPRGLILLLISVTAVLALMLSGCGDSGGGIPDNGPSPAPGVGPVPENGGSEDDGTATEAGFVPEELVGRWNGGSNEQGHWYYEFQADGTYPRGRRMTTIPLSLPEPST